LEASLKRPIAAEDARGASEEVRDGSILPAMEVEVMNAADEERREDDIASTRES